METHELVNGECFSVDDGEINETYQFTCECERVVMRTSGVSCDKCMTYVCSKCIEDNRKDYNLKRDVELCGVCAKSEEV